MATHVTDSIRAQFAELGEAVDLFAALFDAWKNRCAVDPEAEFDSRHFGKDGAYASPSVGGKPYLLRHVHLAPRADRHRLSHWLEALKNNARKTSDRVLVYASASATEHLLLFILDEPDAHAIAQMRTREDRLLMHQFAAVASAFLHDRSIVA